ncbi:MAG: acyl-CoA dehydrogenase family protein [Candidatus Wallbacteria bacterium]|nr:acyl-CoA dehydrogenase family protein [Candidatus Wallbacteria bacterium]
MSAAIECIPDVRCEDFYAADTAFQALLARHLDSTAMDWARPRLHRMGRLAAGEVDRLSFDADANPPRLEPYDRRGLRTERIALHPSYERLKELAYGEGIVADFYAPETRRLLGAQVHRVKFALGYLFAQAEQGLYCPICMTDGAARLIEQFGSDALKTDMLSRLTSRPPAYWQGAMFLTERQGGSDVGASDTSAAQAADGTWRLTGDKWFCSNAETDVAMVLARPEGAPAGTRGLALFAMTRQLPDGTVNPWYVMRLKNKLGTRSMPTGEVRLEGAVAHLVGEPGRGFHYMTEMLNLSRLYNAVASIALIRRALWEGASYARARRAFGKAMAEFPMVQDTLVAMALELEAANAMVFETVATLDRYDAGEAAARPLLRILTPLGKLFTGRLAVRCASETVELLGGNGYVEDRVTARLYRDAQVLPVWEGTTNILVLDSFRALAKEGSLDAFVGAMRARTAVWKGEHATALDTAVGALEAGARELLGQEGDGWTVAARHWCDRAARVFEAVLLADAAARGGARERAAAAAFLTRFVTAPGQAPVPSDLKEQFALLV